MRKHRERAAMYFGLFLVFMLFCTIVSRGIYASRMPKVTAGNIETKTLVREIEANGTVVTKEEVPVVTEAGVLVEKVCVVEGQKVEPGDLLFQVETEDLKRILQQADAQIQTEEAKLSELNASGSTAVNRASQDLQDAADTAAGDVGRAEEAYQAAVRERDSFPSEEEYKKNAYKKDAEYQKLWKASQKKNAAKADKNAFSSYKKSLDASLSESYAQEKSALEDAVSEKEAALSAANTSRSETIKQAQRALEDAKNGGGESGAKKEQQNQIALLKENRERLLKLQQEEGKIFCEISGYVGRISVLAGERTTDASALVLSDANGEKLFQAVLPQEEKAYLTPGDKIDLSFPNGGRQILGIPIESVGDLEDGTCQITAKIADPQVIIGQTAEMNLNKGVGRYECSIPLSALYHDNSSDFVYLIEEKNTILGVEMTARKQKVKVIDQDASYAALETDAFTEEDKLVIETDKEIKDGARVRPVEE